MCGQSRTLLTIVALAIAGTTAATGCHGTSRRTITGSTASSSGEPALSSEIIEPGTPANSVGTSSGSGVTIVEPMQPAATASPTALSWVDRHPLLRKPQQYYDNTNSNKLVKTASAAFVGVPAGIIGEFRQIVVGKPSATTY